MEWERPGAQIDQQQCIDQYSMITNMHQDYIEAGLREPEKLETIKMLAFSFK